MEKKLVVKKKNIYIVTKKIVEKTPHRDSGKKSLKKEEISGKNSSKKESEKIMKRIYKY